MTPWALPDAAVIGGTNYEFNPDYRNVLDIIRLLNDPDTQELVRWHAALALFYDAQVAPEHEQEAMEYLAAFISYGEVDTKPGPKLLDWEQDSKAIIADVNKVAGRELRAEQFVHWWTFLSYFNAIGDGHLSTLISIREKLRKGRKLEKWEQEFYRENRSRVDLKVRYSAEELAQQERLKKLLGE